MSAEKLTNENSIVLLAEQKRKLEEEVAKRKRVEMQLRMSHEHVTMRAIDRESRLQATMENALDAIICIDTSGCVVDFNPAAEDLFGFNQMEVLGQDISDLIVPTELREQHKIGLLSYADKIKSGQDMGGRKRMMDTLGLRADGKKINLEVAISSFSCEDGTHITAFFRDITNRKQFSHALLGTLEVAEENHKELKRQKDVISQANAYMESIVRSMGDALIVFSMAGEIQKVNEPACTLLASSERDLVGQDIYRFFSKDILSGLGSNEMIVCMDTNKAGYNTKKIDGSLVSSDGCKISVLISRSILHNAAGYASGVILVAKDITEYKEAEKALLEKEKQLLVVEKQGQ